MTRLATSPAEQTYNLEGWSRLSSGLEVVLDTVTTPHGGSGSYKAAGDGVQKSSWLSPSMADGDMLFARWYQRHAANYAAAGGSPIGLYAGSSGGPVGGLKFDNAGNAIDLIGVGGGTSEVGGPAGSVAFGVTTWHKIEMAARHNPANARRVEAWVWINGVYFGKFTAGNSTLYGNINRFFATAAAGFAPLTNIDDIIINDGTTGSDNYFPDGVHPALGTAPSAGGVYTVPSIRSHAITGTGAATAASIVATAPATIVSGDLLVAEVTTLGNGTITGPAGWTKVYERQSVGNSITVAIFKKTATGSEPSTYTFTRTGSARWTAHISAVQNASDVGECEIIGVGTSSGTGIVTPTVYDHTGDCLAIFGTLAGRGSTSNATITGDCSTNDHLNYDDPDTTAGWNHHAGTRQQVAGGFSKGDASGTISSTNGVMAGYQVLVKPITGPTVPTTGQLHPRGWKNTSAPASGQLFPRRVIT